MGHSQSNSSSSTPSRSRSSTTVTTRPTIDGGFLEPQSHIYASSLQEYNQKAVQKLILDRRLAPFYLGINDFEFDWTIENLVESLEEAESQASTNVKEALVVATSSVVDSESAQMSTPAASKKSKEGAAAAAIAILHRDRLMEVNKNRDKTGGGGLQWSPKEEQAKLYLGKAIECPICFLYYPPPLVNTRCCDQPICTECFVQIKRADPTPTHLESEPAACPFCCCSNFGVVYTKEVGRPSLATLSETTSNSSIPPVVVKPKPRRKSFAHTEKEVVTTDHIHPDWEAKVEAVKATAARRANRRIVFRQVGDRLVPVGVTSGRSGDGRNITMSTGALPSGFAAQVAAAFDSSNQAGLTGGREGRRAARKRNLEMTQYLESIGMGVGPDLEEMMVLEALRLSMVDDEERQKKAASANGEGEAETSAQGALRSSDTTTTSNTTTANLLADAMDEPMGNSNSGRSSRTSPNDSEDPLPGLPVLLPSVRSNPTATTAASIPSSLPSLNTTTALLNSTSTSLTPSVSTTTTAPQIDFIPPSPIDLSSVSGTTTERPIIPHSQVSSTSLHSLPIVATSEEVINDLEGSELLSSTEGYEALPSPP